LTENLENIDIKLMKEKSEITQKAREARELTVVQVMRDEEIPPKTEELAREFLEPGFKFIE
jgi:hypothetical protein